MSIITPSLSRSFVRHVRFPAAPLRRRGRARGLTDTPPVELKSSEAQTLVVGSSLVVAADRVPKQTREDLVNCTLFAQLAATGEVGSRAKVIDWYGSYFRSLTALGWAQSDSQFEKYEFTGKNAEAHKAIIPVLMTLLSPGAAALTIVKVALDALQSMSENSPWITLFDRQSKVQESARFQVATAEVAESGLVQVALVAFTLRATSSFEQVLFFKFAKSSTRLQYAAGKATIYEAVLAGQRQDIAKRLEAYRKAYVAQVRFPPAPDGAMRAIRR